MIDEMLKKTVFFNKQNIFQNKKFYTYLDWVVCDMTSSTEAHVTVTSTIIEETQTNLKTPKLNKEEKLCFNVK